MSIHNKLTPAQVEKLALLSEELGEAQQAIGKILRHGYDNYHPKYPERTNKMDLEREIGHINCAVRLLVNSAALRRIDVENHCDQKIIDVKRWLHYK